MYSCLLLSLILLILIDLSSKPLIILTALIQFSIYSCIYANHHFYDFVLNNLFLNFILVCILIFCFNCSWYVLPHIYYNLMLFTLVLSVPYFFVYNYRKEILKKKSNQAMLNNVFKIGIKVLIVAVLIINGYDLLSSLLIITWMLVWVYKIYSFIFIDSTEVSLNESSCESPPASVVVKNHHHTSKTTTELEIKKLHDYYKKNLNSTSFTSATKTRYKFYSYNFDNTHF
jgi:hypothetical protein